MDNKKTVLVTGGAGYIGANAVSALQQSGYNVIVLDNLSNGHRHVIDDILQAELIVGDTNDRDLLRGLFSRYPIDAVMHFAAYIAVGESVQQPGMYYRNNVAGTLTLLEAMVEANIPYFVFSSTCAVYEPPKTLPITETHPLGPLSPYAASKAMVEQILSDFEVAHGLKSVRFRYFNASGADVHGRFGEEHEPETHLIPLVLQAALNPEKAITIYGTDYPTPDGTCIRDYIHVVDLAQAHVLGLEYLMNGGASQVFNLGNGNGFSVREVIEAAREVTQMPIRTIESDRRPGDSPILVGSPEKAMTLLNWQPQYADLKVILQHAWNWHAKEGSVHTQQRETVEL